MQVVICDRIGERQSGGDHERSISGIFSSNYSVSHTRRKRFLEEKTGLDQHSASASLEHQESQERPFYETATPEEKAKAFRQWAESHVSESPVLSDEAISRESIYGERGR